jgi:DUF1365 family protein
VTAPRSAIYEGVVLHHRERPREHRFRYRQGWLYLDLAELPDVLDVHPLWSARRPAPAWFRPSDYLTDGDRPLDDAVRNEIARRGGERPDGPIRLLTHPRYWGWCFNPVSFYYVFAADGESLRWVVADVTNTPWQERHAYVLGPFGRDGAAAAGPWSPTSRKVFHVSPFMDMAMEYRWTLHAPGDRLQVTIENHDIDGRLFRAELALRRRTLDRAGLGRLLWGYPWQTARTVGGIHGQALKLWLKRVPFHPHPGNEEMR